MKSKDQILLEELYLETQKSTHKDYYMDALTNPSLYELVLYPIKEKTGYSIGHWSNKTGIDKDP